MGDGEGEDNSVKVFRPGNAKYDPFAPPPPPLHFSFAPVTNGTDDLEDYYGVYGSCVVRRN